MNTPTADAASIVKTIRETGEIPPVEELEPLFNALDEYLEHPPAHDRFVTMRYLPGIVGYSRRWILDEIDAGKFPQPIRINSRRNVWRMSAIQKWMNDFEAAAEGNEKPNNICVIK